MKKTFTLLELETNTGITDRGYEPGILDRDDVQDTDIYKELVEDCGGSKYINVSLKAYSYGEGDGEPEPCDYDDIYTIEQDENFCDRPDVTLLSSESYSILHPDQAQGMSM